MKKREWLIVILPLVATWIVDRITKIWASDITGLHSYGLIGFALHHNHGAMLGLFSDLPAVLRIVSLSTMGAFLVCIYALIQYLLPIKSLMLRSGLSIVLGGILGNVTDRIIYGYVIDFVLFNTQLFNSPVFNIADALQWVGYVMCFYAFIREGELLWPANDMRKFYWINIKFQLKYCFILMGIGLGLALISGVFAFTYLRVTIIELMGNNHYILDRFLNPFIITFFIITIAFCGILFTVGKLISHRIAGPIYAFEKYLSDMADGKDREFKLRTKDEFKHLEKTGHHMRDYINKLKQPPSTF